MAAWMEESGVFDTIAAHVSPCRFFETDKLVALDRHRTAAGRAHLQLRARVDARDDRVARANLRPDRGRRGFLSGTGFDFDIAFEQFP